MIKPTLALLLDGVVVPIVARLVAGRVLDELARADELGYVSITNHKAQENVDLKPYAQAQIDYAQIARDLDELEACSKAALVPLLRDSRDAMLAAVRRARNPRRLARMVRGLRLSGTPKIRATLRAMLRRAWAQGGEDARTEVGQVKTHASYASFTPRGAVQWMNAKELFITGLLGDGIVGKAKGILVNALKTGEAGSVTVEKLWQAFEPFIGDPDVLRDGEPLTPSQLETIIRTNTTEAYNHGRLNEFVREDLLPFLDGVRYSAVMDSRTTPVCAFLDGKVFDPESPDLAELLPPNHYNCRSIIVPIVAGEKIDEADFITSDEVGQAKALADAKFLAQEDVHRSYMIRHEGDEWVVRSADGRKVLGRHKTEDEAKAQLRAIEAAKHNHN